MQIGSLKLENNIILAPLAGITNLPFRLLAKEAGCGLVCSEMVSANGLVHGSPKTLNMLASEQKEKPLSVQLFGSDPAIMSDAAAMVADAGADVLDINLGCSVKKVVKTGAGAGLMRTPDKAEAIFKAVRDAVNIPLTIKIRSGWTISGEQAIHIAEMAEACGVDAIAVHPRSASQGFRGSADWEVIGRVKKKLRIPVIGNGDIRLPEDAARMVAQTGCDAVMIGRRAIGYPWIFTQIRSAFDGRLPKTPTISEQFEIMEQYVQVSVSHLGEEMACRLMRSRLAWFVKAMPHSSHFRDQITRVRCEADIIEKIRRFQQKMVDRGTDRPADS